MSDLGTLMKPALMLALVFTFYRWVEKDARQAMEEKDDDVQPL